MKKSVLLPVAMAVLVAAWVVLVSTEATARPAKPPKSSGKTTTSYTVVKIGDEYKAITSSSLNDEKKRLNEEFKSETKKWNDDKKKESGAEKPVKKTFTTVKSGFKSKEDADKYVTELKERDEEKGSGKGGGKSDKDKPVF